VRAEDEHYVPFPSSTALAKPLNLQRAAWYFLFMIKELAQAVATVSALSAERQAYAASVLRQIASVGGTVHHLSDDERQLLNEGLADLDNGNVVADAELAAFWNRHAV
jgi:hypothetical protein